MTTDWPTGLDGLPVPEIPVAPQGYATRSCCLMLTLRTEEHARLMALWPGLEGGFALVAADGLLVQVTPTTAPHAQALPGDWLKVRFDASVEERAAADSLADQRAGRI